MRAACVVFVVLLGGACSGKKDRPPPLSLGEGGIDRDAGQDAGADAGDAGNDDAGGDDAGADAGDGGGDAAPECDVPEDCDDLNPCNEDTCTDRRCQHLDLAIVDRDHDGDVDDRCGGDDCDDANPDVPSAAELCNHVDDDCDGAVDEGMLREDDDVQVAPGTTTNVALEQGFGGFGAIWADASNAMQFARLDASGAIVDGPHDLGGIVVVDSPGDAALVATSDGFLAAWCSEDGVTDHLNYVRIPDGAGPELPVEVDLAGADLCFNPSAAYSDEVVALAWMAVDGADYLPSVVLLNVDGSEAVAAASFPDTVANDRSIDVEWLGTTFGVFFRADIGGLLADGGKYFLLGEDGTMGIIREFDDDGPAILADVVSDGTLGILAWTLDGDDGLISRRVEPDGNLSGSETEFAPGATYPTVTMSGAGILGGWVTTQPVVAPLGASSVTTINVSDRNGPSGPPAVAGDDTGFGVLWPEGDVGLYFDRVACP